MSMLAERKRKQKFSLNPRGKAWSEDSSKFGQKLMEKMGWSKGKGLGAKEDGITEHVRVSYKNDSRGMGYKETEEWTQHEENYSALLQNLSEAADGDGESEIRVSSLEEKSKNSKARLHYKKFTRGKDLSRYSEKDLANIFGKKTLKKTREGDATEKSAEVEEENECTFGVETVNGGSMTDYFKQKMTSFTERANTGNESEEEGTTYGFGFQPEEEGEKLKTKKRKTEGSLEEQGLNTAQNCEDKEAEGAKVKKTKQKKNKKAKHNDNTKDPILSENMESVPKKKKKKKKVEEE